MGSAARKMFADRHVDPAAVSVPTGFTVEVVAVGLNNPSCIEFDEDDKIYIGEMGTSIGSAYEPGQVLVVRENRTAEAISSGFEGSITGIAYLEGAST